MNALTNTEKERYERQLLLPEIDETKQQNLKQKKVLIVGAGGLGSPILYYLVAAGVGHITIVDDDKVNLSNLQRQILYKEDDLGFYKSMQAKKRLQELNSSCIINSYTERFSEENAMEIATGVDIIIDGCDNLATRYLLDETAKRLSIPYLYGAIEGWVGHCSIFHCGTSKSYRELFLPTSNTEDTKTVSVMGAAVGIIASIMATESLKFLLGIPPSLAGKLLIFDSLKMEQTIFSIQA